MMVSSAPIAQSSGAWFQALKPSSGGVSWTRRHFTCVRLPSRSCGNSTVVVRLPLKPGALCEEALGRVKMPDGATSTLLPSGWSTHASSTSRVCLSA